MGKLNLRYRAQIERVINGALQAAINDHGPIDKQNTYSATKRIYGGLKCLAKDKDIQWKRQKPKRRRRWGLSIWRRIKYWQCHVAKPLGKPPFVYETWIGPICFRLWKNPKSVYGKAIRIIR